jgi:hypothetical protein
VITVSINQTRSNGGGSNTIAIFEIDDEDPKATPMFTNAPDVKTMAMVRKAFDYLDAEAESFKKG